MVAVLMALTVPALLTGCDQFRDFLGVSEEEPPQEDDKTDPFTEILAFLQNSPDGSKANPVNLPKINVGYTWEELLDIIEKGGKYVNMDLYGCILPESGAFNSNTNNPGKGYVVGLVLPDTATSITGKFESLSSLKSVIGNDAFERCTSLQTVDLPAATKIGTWAFSYCTGLSSVNLPAVTEIGSYAFREIGSTALTVTLGSNPPKVGSSNVYQTDAKNITVKVPKDARKAYIDAGWEKKESNRYSASAFFGGPSSSNIPVTIVEAQ
jgi:hypothetical protein